MFGIEPGVIAIIGTFSIPLAAVVGHYYLKIKKLELQNRSPLNHEDIQLLRQQLSENKELRQRVENLEEIITDLDKDSLKIEEKSRNRLSE